MPLSLILCKDENLAFHNGSKQILMVTKGKTKVLFEYSDNINPPYLEHNTNMRQHLPSHISNTKNYLYQNVFMLLIKNKDNNEEYRIQ